MRVIMCVVGTEGDREQILNVVRTRIQLHNIIVIYIPTLDDRGEN